MARVRKYSTALETARIRLAALKSIIPAPNLGSYLTIPDYEGNIVSVEDKLARYNQTLVALDEMLSEFADEERALKDLNARYLSAFEAKYGPDSSEYEMAGGTRKSERRRPTRRAAAR